MANALDVVGQLMVEMGGSSARIEAQGDRIIVELPSLRAGYSLLKGMPGGKGRGQAIARVHDGLTTAGLGLEVRVGSRTIGLLGVGARANLASRLLGVSPMEIRLNGLAGLRRRSGS